MPKRCTISDGKLVLHLVPAGGGWFAITSPLDPGLITQARSIEEAFEMAYDAMKCLKAARTKLARDRNTAARRGPASKDPQSSKGRRLRKSVESG